MNTRELRFLRGKVELRAVTPEQQAAGYIGVLSGFIPYESDSRELRDAAGRAFIERLAPGVFTRALAEPGHAVLADVGHNDAATFARRGVNLELTETAAGLGYTALLPDTTVGRDLRTNVQLGIIDGTSFEFEIRSEGGQRTGESWAKRGAEAIRTIREAILHRVNPVTEPAYLHTALAARAAGADAAVTVPEALSSEALRSPEGEARANGPTESDLATRLWEQRARFL